MDCIWVNSKNVGPPFFKFISVHSKMSFTQLENHSQLLCGRDFANEGHFLCQFDVRVHKHNQSKVPKIARASPFNNKSRLSFPSDRELVEILTIS